MKIIEPKNVNSNLSKIEPYLKFEKKISKNVF
jgi:hypothetical protein